jgi:hypothetical protein
MGAYQTSVLMDSSFRWNDIVLQVSYMRKQVSREDVSIQDPNWSFLSGLRAESHYPFKYDMQERNSSLPGIPNIVSSSFA